MFTAVVPSDEVVAELEEFLDPRREAAPFRWTRSDSWHLTLSFMGNVPDRAVDDLVERLGRAGNRRTPFTLALQGGGTFPNPARAKLLYAAVTGDPAALTELDRLATGARAAGNRAGAAVDGSRFTAHLTLARMNRPVEATRWLRVLDAFRSRSFEVTEFALIASHLGEGPGNRPRYERVGTFPLGALASRANPPETVSG